MDLTADVKAGRGWLAGHDGPPLTKSVLQSVNPHV